MAFRMHGSQDRIVYVYAPNNTPMIGSLGTLITMAWNPVTLPSHVSMNDVVQDPVFLSTNKTTAKRWRYTHGVGFADITMPVAYGNTEYVLMITPNGSVYAYGLNDDGTFYIEPFDSAVPRDRNIRMTLMHKGPLVFVADNRQPTPRKGDV